MKKSKEIRLQEVDFLRGLAIIGMIIFHLFFILDYFGILKNEMYQGFWLVLVRFVQITFLTLVGISLSLSYQRRPSNFQQRQIKRALLIGLCALMISTITYIFIPQEYVRFGILHLIALSIFLLSFTVRFSKFSLLIGIYFILSGFYIGNFASKNLFLTIIGFDIANYFTLDHFPILPWMGLPAIGIFIGNRFFGQNKTLIKSSILDKIPLISTLGKKSLLIYLIHIPLILTILLVFQVIPLSKILNL